MKFAHIADTHLGASFRERKLEELNFLAFKKALDVCIENDVDFILLCGDIFHHSIPDLKIVERAIEELLRVKDYGIEIYAICGSHDISHISTDSIFGVVSIVGVLAKARILKSAYVVDDSSQDLLRLKPVEDKKTGVKIFGMPGLPKGIERELYEKLDRDYLNEVEGDKIFLFHSSIIELMSDYIYDKNPIPLSLLPSGFRYYAGGHMHYKRVYEYDNAYVVYPGPLFGASYSDLENNEEKGFYIVEDFIPNFVPVRVCNFEIKSFDATGKHAIELEKELRDYVSQDHTGKVILMRVIGELGGGKTTDIDFNDIRELALRTAEAIIINRYSLRERDISRIEYLERYIDDIENSILSEIVTSANNGITLDFVHSLLSALRVEKGDRPRRDYEEEVKKRFWDVVKDYVSTGKVHTRQSRLDDYFSNTS